MKKILALVLALMLVFSTSVIAFAADDIVADAGNAKGDVYVDIVSEGDYDSEDLSDVYADEAKYRIELDLVDYTFTFTMGDYDTTNHTYGNGNWDKQSATINVTNHSNTRVSVTPALTNGTAQQGVTASLSAALNLSSAVNTNGVSDTITLSIAGTPTALAKYQLDTVTLTIAGTNTR